MASYQHGNFCEYASPPNGRDLTNLTLRSSNLVERKSLFSWLCAIVVSVRQISLSDSDAAASVCIQYRIDVVTYVQKLASGSRVYLAKLSRHFVMNRQNLVAHEIMWDIRPDSPPLPTHRWSRANSLMRKICIADVIEFAQKHAKTTVRDTPRVSLHCLT